MALQRTNRSVTRSLREGGERESVEERPIHTERKRERDRHRESEGGRETDRERERGREREGEGEIYVDKMKQYATKSHCKRQTFWQKYGRFQLRSRFVNSNNNLSGH